VDELDTLKNRASTLIAQSGSDPGALERGAQLLRIAEEIEKHRAETQKLRREASGTRLLDYVKILAPWAAVVVGAVTIMVQSSQNRTDKVNATWVRTSSAVANGSANLAEVGEFVEFLNSKEHQQDARHAAEGFLKSGPVSLDAFRLLFDNLYPHDILYGHVGSNESDDALQVDRALLDNYNFATQNNPKDPKREQAMLDELVYITTKVTPVLKNRKPGAPLDLEHVILLDGDFSKVNLSGAKLYGFDPERMDMHGAILNADDSHDYADKWVDTAWWEAQSINPDFLKNLEDKAPFNPKTSYGKNSNPTLEEYCRRTSKLGMPDTAHCPLGLL